MMMLEKHNLEIAKLMDRWLRETLGKTKKSKP
jgi:hypothetical protein